MIITLTPNPSLDRTLHISQLMRGQVLRADAAAGTVASGKGVNVSRNLAANGFTTTAVLPVGGPDGHRLVHELEAESMAVRAVPINGSVRSNLTLLEPDGTATKVNEPGPRLSESELALLVRTAVDSCAGADWLVGSGSLPPGAPVDFYARLVAAARAGGSGSRVAIDCTGGSLLAAVVAGADLVQPNTAELAQALGTDLGTLADVVAAARRLLDLGAGAVLASLGADGAVLVGRHRAYYAPAPPTRLHSAVGAGDALLSGLLAGGGPAAGAGALSLGVAYATRRCELPAGAALRVSSTDLGRVSATMLIDPQLRKPGSSVPDTDATVVLTEPGPALGPAPNRP